MMYPAPQQPSGYFREARRPGWDESEDCIRDLRQEGLLGHGILGGSCVSDSDGLGGRLSTLDARIESRAPCYHSRCMHLPHCVCVGVFRYIHVHLHMHACVHDRDPASSNPCQFRRDLPRSRQSHHCLGEGVSEHDLEHTA